MYLFNVEPFQQTPKLHNISDASDLIDGVAEVVKNTQPDTLIAMGKCLKILYVTIII